MFEHHELPKIHKYGQNPRPKHELFSSSAHTHTHSLTVDHLQATQAIYFSALTHGKTQILTLSERLFPHPFSPKMCFQIPFVPAICRSCGSAKPIPDEQVRCVVAQELNIYFEDDYVSKCPNGVRGITTQQKADKELERGVKCGGCGKQ